MAAWNFSAAALYFFSRNDVIAFDYVCRAICSLGPRPTAVFILSYCSCGSRPGISPTSSFFSPASITASGAMGPVNRSAVAVEIAVDALAPCSPWPASNTAVGFMSLPPLRGADGFLASGSPLQGHGAGNSATVLNWIRQTPRRTERDSTAEREVSRVTATRNLYSWRAERERARPDDEGGKIRGLRVRRQEQRTSDAAISHRCQQQKRSALAV